MKPDSKDYPLKTITMFEGSLTRFVMEILFLICIYKMVLNYLTKKIKLQARHRGKKGLLY